MMRCSRGRSVNALRMCSATSYCGRRGGCGRSHLSSNTIARDDGMSSVHRNLHIMMYSACAMVCFNGTECQCRKYKFLNSSLLVHTTKYIFHCLRIRFYRHFHILHFILRTKTHPNFYLACFFLSPSHFFFSTGREEPAADHKHLAEIGK